MTFAKEEDSVPFDARDAAKARRDRQSYDAEVFEAPHHDREVEMVKMRATGKTFICHDVTRLESAEKFASGGGIEFGTVRILVWMAGPAPPLFSQRIIGHLRGGERLQTDFSSVQLAVGLIPESFDLYELHISK